MKHVTHARKASKLRDSFGLRHTDDSVYLCLFREDFVSGDVEAEVLEAFHTEFRFLYIHLETILRKCFHHQLCMFVVLAWRVRVDEDVVHEHVNKLPYVRP